MSKSGRGWVFDFLFFDCLFLLKCLGVSFLLLGDESKIEGVFCVEALRVCLERERLGFESSFLFRWWKTRVESG